MPLVATGHANRQTSAIGNDFGHNEKMKKAPTSAAKRSTNGFTLGRRQFAKISAVEGMALSAEMKADFDLFDQQGLSGEERRKALARKYGKG